ncbi:hypothetical protein ABAC460_16250 [Asticcacaulis sp. AC460]|uniref:DUF1761 domain-containing protein n=1 Tax=Asticcacaulis sp. AC460 TaxID=1282360 RepID=UPI0003C3C9BD|nr:DUF1761 domain-containing protein [Asticcacaulis sp. AC460]ESQ88212.1 hypothetical protein ABAC460_16250 [Asticcacaulis sp. AC460]
MPEINWLATVAAAIAAFGLGGVWYSPLLFGKAWQREAGVSDEAMKNGNMGVIFGGAFALTLLASVVFAFFLGPKPALPFAVGAGAAAGIAWVAAAFGINYLFERKSLTLFAINGGYNALLFTVIGLILGLWH